MPWEFEKFYVLISWELDWKWIDQLISVATYPPFKKDIFYGGYSPTGTKTFVSSPKHLSHWFRWLGIDSVSSIFSTRSLTQMH